MEMVERGKREEGEGVRGRKTIEGVGGIVVDSRGNKCFS